MIKTEELEGTLAKKDDRFHSQEGIFETGKIISRPCLLPEESVFLSSVKQ